MHRPDRHGPTHRNRACRTRQERDAVPAAVPITEPAAGRLPVPVRLPRRLAGVAPHHRCVAPPEVTSERMQRCVVRAASVEPSQRAAVSRSRSRRACAVHAVDHVEGFAGPPRLSQGARRLHSGFDGAPPTTPVNRVTELVACARGAAGSRRGGLGAALLFRLSNYRMRALTRRTVPVAPGNGEAAMRYPVALARVRWTVANSGRGGTEAFAA